MGVITRGIANNILSGGTIDATDGLSGTVSASNITDSSISSVTAFPAAAGDFIQSTASDPSPATIGDVWYNNATYAFKLATVTTSGTWASGGNANTARGQLGSAGIQTATLIFGGEAPGGNSNVTESYNGTSWTTVPATMNTTRRQLGGVGTQTAALGFGGDTSTGSTGQTASSESYNGTSWTSTPSMNTTRQGPGPAQNGTQTAALAFGGALPPGGNSTSSASESWNGTSWTSTPSLNTSRRFMLGAGTNTAALGMGGNTQPDATVATVESWNGTSWTTGTSMSNVRTQGSGFGTQTLAIACAAFPGKTQTELWNGSSWTAQGALATSAYGRGGAGTSSDGIVGVGVAPGGNTTATEEYSGPGSPVTKTITTS